MSSPRYDWWGYAKGMIRRYQSLKAEHEALQAQSMTASYTGMPSGSNVENRPVEQVAMRGLTGVALKEYEAVDAAVRYTQGLANGEARLQVIDLVLWRRSHTLEGAALAIPCSISSAWRWHGDFIRRVAKCYGLLDS